MRPAFSLVELLLAIAILSLLLAIAIPGVLKARAIAARVECSNKQKQLALAALDYASSHRGKLPSLGLINYDERKYRYVEFTLFLTLLPYCDPGVAAAYEQDHVTFTKQGYGIGGRMHKSAAYVCASDPTLPAVTKPAHPAYNDYPLTSYGANYQVFDKPLNMQFGFTDGASNTVFFAEHYGARCGLYSFSWGISTNHWFSLHGDPSEGGMHTSSFADTPNWTYVGDIYPVTRGNPPITLGSDPKLTFQLAPRWEDCDYRIPQTPHAGGMPTAFGDGSVRVLAGGISPAIFWGAVTPNGGEILDHNW